MPDEFLLLYTHMNTSESFKPFLNPVFWCLGLKYKIGYKSWIFSWREMSLQSGNIFLGSLEPISIVYGGFLGRRIHFSRFQDDWTTVGPTRGHPKWGHGPKMCFLYFLFNSVDRKCMGIFCGGESISERFRTIWPLLDSLGATPSRAVGQKLDFLYFLCIL